MPSPEQADIKCSMVLTLAPAFEIVDASLVSVTAVGETTMSTGSGKSMRRNTIPVLT